MQKDIGQKTVPLFMRHELYRRVQRLAKQGLSPHAIAVRERLPLADIERLLRR